MRITGGIYKGRVLPIAVTSGVRPTSSRVREALFSMVGNQLHGCTWFDAFGGAGLTALEAASRGAIVTVVEKNGRAYRDIVARGRAFDVAWTVKKGDVLRSPPPQGSFDTVFIDPPYALELEPIVTILGPVSSRRVIVESVSDRTPLSCVEGFVLDRHRVYGNSALSIYLRSSDE